MTVTDAAMITGILGHGIMGFGAISPRLELAEAAAAPIASQLGLTAPQLAEGALRVAVSGMLVAIEQLLARAGLGASELTLMPFGGAGPMLGALLAEAADIRRILVPAMPGTLCALGAASAAIRRDTMRTVLLPLAKESMAAVEATFDALEAEAEASIAAMVGAGPSAISRTADLRYQGQSFEIPVPVERGQTVAQLVAAFHAAHDQAFGHADHAASVQVVNLRVSGSRPPPRIRLPSSPAVAHAAPSSKAVRVFQGGAWVEAKLFHRAQLTPGATLSGPAIVVQDDTTLLVPPRWAARVDEFHNILMERA